MGWVIKPTLLFEPCSRETWPNNQFLETQSTGVQVRWVQAIEDYGSEKNWSCPDVVWWQCQPCQVGTEGGSELDKLWWVCTYLSIWIPCTNAFKITSEGIPHTYAMWRTEGREALSVSETRNLQLREQSLAQLSASPQISRLLFQGFLSHIILLFLKT